MELITLTDKEMARYEVVRQVINGNLSTKAATQKLGLTDRQLRRLKSQVRMKGVNGVIHGNRGKISNRRIDPDLEEKIVETIQRKYHDFGPTLAWEKLTEVEKIKCTLSTIRNIMITREIWRPKNSKKPTPRALRLRRAMYGEMIQYDTAHITSGLRREAPVRMFVCS